MSPSRSSCSRSPSSSESRRVSSDSSVPSELVSPRRSVLLLSSLTKITSVSLVELLRFHERPVLTLKGTRKDGCREQKLYSAMYKKHIRHHQNLFPPHYRQSLLLCLFRLLSPFHLAVSRPHARLARPTAALYPSFLLHSPDFTSDIQSVMDLLNLMVIFTTFQVFIKAAKQAPFTCLVCLEELFRSVCLCVCRF